MTELAGDWLATLSDETLGTFDGVKAAFDARYKTPEMTKLLRKYLRENSNRERRLRNTSQIFRRQHV